MSETEAAYFNGGSSDGLVITAVARSFLANRISYSFGFHGEYDYLQAQVKISSVSVD